jgi:hypothetical protein
MLTLGSIGTRWYMLKLLCSIHQVQDCITSSLGCQLMRNQSSSFEQAYAFIVSELHSLPPPPHLLLVPTASSLLPTPSSHSPQAATFLINRCNHLLTHSASIVLASCSILEDNPMLANGTLPKAATAMKGLTHLYVHEKKKWLLLPLIDTCCCSMSCCWQLCL